VYSAWECTALDLRAYNLSCGILEGIPILVSLKRRPFEHLRYSFLHLSHATASVCEHWPASLGLPAPDRREHTATFQAFLQSAKFIFTRLLSSSIISSIIIFIISYLALSFVKVRRGTSAPTRNKSIHRSSYLASFLFRRSSYSPQLRSRKRKRPGCFAPFSHPQCTVLRIV